MRSQVGPCPAVHVSDYSDYYTQLAIQGPRAAETMAKLTDADSSAIKNYWFTWGTVCGLHNTLIARTGYTGEDGFEIYMPSDEPTSVSRLERGARSGQGVWHSALRPGRAQHAAPGVRRWPSTATRSPTRSTSSRPAGPLLQAGEGSLCRLRSAAQMKARAVRSGNWSAWR